MTSLIVALLVPLVLVALGALSHSSARQVGGWHIVEYNAGLKGFAWLLVVFASGVAIGSLFLSGTDQIYVLAISFIFTLPAGLLLAVSYGTKIAFNDRGVQIKRPLKRTFFADWEEIVNVSGSRGSYTVQLNSHEPLSLHRYMSGVPTLLREMQKREIRGSLLAEALSTESSRF